MGLREVLGLWVLQKRLDACGETRLFWMFLLIGKHLTNEDLSRSIFGVVSNEKGVRPMFENSGHFVL